MQKNKILLFTAAVFIIAGSYLAATKLFKQSQQTEMAFLKQKNAEVFVRPYSPKYGEADAKVFLVEFLDPECESCRRLFKGVKSIVDSYPGKVQLVVRYAAFHKNSKVAIRALEAARLQGKYWESMGLLFERQPEWGNHQNPKPELIFEFLADLGLDMEKLREDMKSFVIENYIAQDAEDLQILGVRGTPTFFVNGKPLPRFGLGELQKLVNSQVEELYFKK